MRVKTPIRQQPFFNQYQLRSFLQKSVLRKQHLQLENEKEIILLLIYQVNIQETCMKRRMYPSFQHALNIVITKACIKRILAPQYKPFLKPLTEDTTQDWWLQGALETNVSITNFQIKNWFSQFAFILLEVESFQYNIINELQYRIILMPLFDLILGQSMNKQNLKIAQSQYYQHKKTLE
ncbi:hypothetical protein TTHERM_000716219 (macronuclear) [Tetrahymena thermophila SB210]|uniref:Uncharacterized protein n=1 Tax=Tetrahymena thermophila (strain SB210) TaxID=312017 RepID=W7WY98_TETTS|nr:hypothetical protein TTHERM_000716219 [Tetrahymena thermophila SB210]EWS71825.1 hypothetical protein TTHERM_000716219 [Tetrahymena thermophila SB210]|eukprot:XP_012655647.1 hypothetical protein TTHERM_000716219 [Tetrahymena thermophila SB210]